MVIVVKEISPNNFEQISGNPVVKSLDGTEQAPLMVLLSASWTDADRARFGIYYAIPFVVPAGKNTIGSPSYQRAGNTIYESYAVEDIPPPPQAEQDRIAYQNAINEVVLISANKLVVDTTISATERAKLIVIYPEWEVDKAVVLDDLRRYSGALYKCIQAHTTQADWTPPIVPALWTPAVAAGSIGAWRQPTGAQDAYRAGSIVTYANNTWSTSRDYNVWQPGTVDSGWWIYTV